MPWYMTCLQLVNGLVRLDTQGLNTSQNHRNYRSIPSIPVLVNSQFANWKMAIEIDGLPNLKMVIF